MSRRIRIGWVAGVLLAGTMFAEVYAERAHAGPLLFAFVELRPERAGPYHGGETLTVEVRLFSGNADAFTVELIQLDFLRDGSRTDAEPHLQL